MATYQLKGVIVSPRKICVAVNLPDPGKNNSYHIVSAEFAAADDEIVLLFKDVLGRPLNAGPDEFYSFLVDLPAAVNPHGARIGLFHENAISTEDFAHNRDEIFSRSQLGTCDGFHLPDKAVTIPKKCGNGVIVP